MDSILKIKYYIYDIFGKRVETDLRAEAEASFEEGKFVYEVHETTWRAEKVSGQHVVQHEWQQPNQGG
jgi:hypothetical protein